MGDSDFFSHYMVQFWEGGQMFNIDSTPDTPTAAPSP